MNVIRILLNLVCGMLYAADNWSKGQLIIEALSIITMVEVVLTLLN